MESTLSSLLIAGKQKVEFGIGHSSLPRLWLYIESLSKIPEQNISREYSEGSKKSSMLIVHAVFMYLLLYIANLKTTNVIKIITEIFGVYSALGSIVIWH